MKDSLVLWAEWSNFQDVSNCVSAKNDVQLQIHMCPTFDIGVLIRINVKYDDNLWKNSFTVKWQLWSSKLTVSQETEYMAFQSNEDNEANITQWIRVGRGNCKQASGFLVSNWCLTSWTANLIRQGYGQGQPIGQSQSVEQSIRNRYRGCR